MRELTPARCEEYLTDASGVRKAVLVPIGEWERILDALEDLDDIHVYDEAKRALSDPVPFEQAVREIQSDTSSRRGSWTAWRRRCAENAW